ncbi:MAG: hypothetical protein ABW292_14950 [Vicinamibacterales bacterium]
MRYYRVIVCALITGGLAGSAEAQTPLLSGFRDFSAELAIRQSVAGAAARLAVQGCQDILDELADRSGNPLSRLLASKRTSPVEAFNGLRFVEARDTARCGAGMTLAYTLAGSPVIGICGAEFSRIFATDRRAAEITLIHEFLHSIGLGENPPTSREITQRVVAKCGNQPRGSR